jgi:hypothetical protein
MTFYHVFPIRVFERIISFATRLLFFRFIGFFPISLNLLIVLYLHDKQMFRRHGRTGCRRRSHNKKLNHT